MASQITSPTQPFIHTQIKENIKATRHWPLCGEFTGAGEFPHKGPVTRKIFPFDDVIMPWWAPDQLLVYLVDLILRMDIFGDF